LRYTLRTSFVFSADRLAIFAALELIRTRITLASLGIHEQVARGAFVCIQILCVHSHETQHRNTLVSTKHRLYTKTRYIPTPGGFPHMSSTAETSIVSRAHDKTPGTVDSTCTISPQQDIHTREVGLLVGVLSRAAEDLV